MKHGMTLMVAVALLGLCGSALAGGDAKAGKVKAEACAACHGANGEGSSPSLALAGKKQDKLLHDLREYKSGKKNHAMMKVAASKLSEEDMEDLAAYYALLKGK